MAAAFGAAGLAVAFALALAFGLAAVSFERVREPILRLGSDPVPSSLLVRFSANYLTLEAFSLAP